MLGRPHINIVPVLRFSPGWLLVALTTASCAAGDVRSQTSPSPGFQFRHGTLAVVVIDTNQIVIAIDSRMTIRAAGKTNRVQDDVKKVIQLSADVGFFFTGAGRFEGRRWTNALHATVRALAADSLAEKKPIQIEKLVREFKERVETDLSLFTVGDILFLYADAQKYQSSNIFTAVFAGRDADATLKMFRVTCTAIVDPTQTPIKAKLAYDVSEDKLTNRRSFLFFGSTGLFDPIRAGPKSRIAASFRQIRNSYTLLPEPVAAALLDVGVSEAGDAADSPVGYPLYVYICDADGFRLTREVKKGEGVSFDRRNQNKE